VPPAAPAAANAASAAPVEGSTPKAPPVGNLSHGQHLAEKMVIEWDFTVIEWDFKVTKWDFIVI
jgi:hypothetical protein